MNTRPHILLIDDNPAWLETLTDYLTTRGFAVRTADAPSRGLSLLDEDDIRAVVLDYEMPEMDGLELLRRIRRRRPVPVLLLSSADDPTLPRRALAEGARSFLPKDLRPRQFLERLRQLLGDALAESAPPRPRRSA